MRTREKEIPCMEAKPSKFFANAIALCASYPNQNQIHVFITLFHCRVQVGGQPKYLLLSRTADTFPLTTHAVKGDADYLCGGVEPIQWRGCGAAPRRQSLEICAHCKTTSWHCWCLMKAARMADWQICLLTALRKGRRPDFPRSAGGGHADHGGNTFCVFILKFSRFHLRR